MVRPTSAIRERTSDAISVTGIDQEEFYDTAGKTLTNGPIVIDDPRNTRPDCRERCAAAIPSAFRHGDSLAAGHTVTERQLVDHISALCRQVIQAAELN